MFYLQNGKSNLNVVFKIDWFVTLTYVEGYRKNFNHPQSEENIYIYIWMAFPFYFIWLQTSTRHFLTCNVFELLDDMLGISCMYLINLMMKYDWHCYDPEDWWGRSSWCAGPYPTDRCQRTGTHGDMISSDLHGAEEPIRWLLGWQRQGNVVMSHCTRRKKDVPPKTLW